MSASFIHKRRGYVGSVDIPSCMGTRRVHQWEAWRKLGTANTLEEAKDAVHSWRKMAPGMYEDAIFHRGKKVHAEGGV